MHRVRDRTQYHVSGQPQLHGTNETWRIKKRSRHISIRHFWVVEMVADGEVVIEHLGTQT